MLSKCLWFTWEKPGQSVFSVLTHLKCFSCEGFRENNRRKQVQSVFNLYLWWPLGTKHLEIPKHMWIPQENMPNPKHMEITKYLQYPNYIHNPTNENRQKHNSKTNEISKTGIYRNKCEVHNTYRIQNTCNPTTHENPMHRQISYESQNKWNFTNTYQSKTHPKWRARES